MRIEQLEDRLVANSGWYIPEPIRLVGNEVSVRMHDDGEHTTITDGVSSWMYDSGALWALALVAADQSRGVKIVGENILGGRSEFVKEPSAPAAPLCPDQTNLHGTGQSPAQATLPLEYDAALLNALLSYHNQKAKEKNL